ncbi:MAG TPA: hypothetical protein VJ436_14610 [Anaerolineales bacterium]|nr:hypothetical protein [Anaerolineales bacterium]
MIVEFIGSTGAGKTRLVGDVQRSLAKKAEVTTSFDLVAARMGVRGVTNSSAKNLISEVIAFPYFLRSLNKHKEFIAFILRMLARQSQFTFFTLNNLRSLERKLGVYEIIKRADQNRIILVDEGTVLCAHNMFVFTDAVYTHEEIARFASLVPLPDTIVYLRAPVEVLVQRSLLRKDPPREMRLKNRALINQYVERAVKLFDQLIEAENIHCRSMIVEYQDFIDHGNEHVADRISDFILKKINKNSYSNIP